MDIYITRKSTGERLRIPLLPDRVNVKTGAMVVPFQIIKLGEAKIPRGSALTMYSWNGVFPGRSMSDMSFVFDWQEPNRIVSLLKEWEANGETLTLMVTETTINADVFIESFTFEHYGVDNVSYTLGLTQIREVYVTTNPEPPVQETKGSTATESKPDSQKQYGTVRTNGANLNIRKGAGTDSKILGKLKNGSKIEILGKKGNWYQIEYEGSTAYISASYVKMDGSGSSKSSSASSKKSKSGSTSAQKKTTATSSGSNTTTKKSLVVDKPSTSLIKVAANAVKKITITDR